MRTLRVSARSLTVAALAALLAAPVQAIDSPLPSGKGLGLRGEYRNSTDFSGPAVYLRTDPTIDFNWNWLTPAYGVRMDRFSVRWTGEVEAPVTGAFRFATTTDGGVRLWVDGAKLVDNWTQHSSTTNTANAVTLTAGRRYAVRMEFADQAGTAAAKLLWSYPGQTAAQVIPQARLFPPASTFLSDLTWTSATNGSGPVERDKSVGGAGTGDGRLLSIGGAKFAKGLGVRAPSEIKYALGGRYSDFTASIGVDDEIPGRSGALKFQVWRDGAKVYESHELNAMSRARYIQVDVAGANELKLVVLDSGGGAANDHADWADAQLSMNSQPYLSDLDWKSAVSGWGPAELDQSNGERGSGDGRMMTIAGRQWTRGLGVHAASDVRYNLNGAFTRFTAMAGVDDEVPAKMGTVIFQVFADGAKLFESPVMKQGDAAVPIDVSLGGKRELRLLVLESTNGSSYDHADWAEARLTRGVAPPPAPVTPPAAPANLSAIGGDGRVNLKWSEAARATTYNVLRSLTAGGATTPAATGVRDEEFVDRTVTNGTKYFYKIVGVNDAGAGAASNEANATPAGVVTVPVKPGPPSTLTAAPSTGKITLAWGAAFGAASYNVYRGTSAGGQSGSPLASSVNGTGFADTNVDAGKTYFYKVAGVNAAGIGALSNEASATPPAALPAAPSGLSAAGEDKQVKLAWSAAAGAMTYRVFRKISGGQETVLAQTVNGVAFTDTTVTNGTKYFYRVAGVNATGAGPMSNEANATPQSALPAAPTGLSAAGEDKQVKLAWSAAAGAVTYKVFRGTAAGGESATAVAMDIAGTSFTDTGRVNGTKYFYKVAAVNGAGTGPMSNEASATAQVALPPAPTGLAATGVDAEVKLVWAITPGAATYNVFRGAAAGAEAATAIATGLTSPAYSDTKVVNGTAYFYKVAAVNPAGASGMSNEATATPQIALPGQPAGVTATSGDKEVRLSWNAVPGATSYKLFRGLTAGVPTTTPLVSTIATPSYTDPSLTNGTAYFYKVAAVNAAGTGLPSLEVTATPNPVTAPPSDAIHRFLRQSSWGPTQATMDRVKAIGIDAYLDEQFNTAASVYPDALYGQSLEWSQEQMTRNAVNGPDQLRQRVAWALHKIWVVSGLEVNNPRAYLAYYRILQDGAFGNYLDLMRAVTLTPAMGEYLDMVNNGKATATSQPNENYPRELMQLFTLGLYKLNPDGSQQIDPVTNAPASTYEQADVLELARALTGWTYNNDAPGNPTSFRGVSYSGPMEPVESQHDIGTKTVLGTPMPSAQTATADLDNALRIIFNHPNVGPFICRNLIQQLVTSNPSPAYIQRIATVFANNGSGVRGDLRAVVRAILKDSEAALGQSGSGHLREPVLYIANVMRALSATVVDHPFLTDASEEMSQRIFYPNSVFSYFSPSYRTGGVPAPEFQIYSTFTSLRRPNFIARLLSGGFGSDLTVDYAPWNAIAADTNALVERANTLLMGGQMSASMRGAIVTAINASPSQTEKVRTVLYLTLTSSQYQVEH